MNFEQLLDGATKGPWFAVRNSHYYELNTEDRDAGPTIAMFASSKCNFGEVVEKINTEYVARLSPAVMSEVWAALKLADNALKDYIPDLEARGASLNYGRSVLRKLDRALALLDGQTEKGGAE